MDQAILLRDYGLSDAISTISMMKSEEVALFGYIFDNDQCAEISYMELHEAVDGLVSQLVFRHGIKEGDRIIINCSGHCAAEVVACLACCRLKATFVPIDSEWQHIGDRLVDIISDCDPVAAIVVAESDSDNVVKALANAGLHRCILMQSSGVLVYEDSWQALCSNSNGSSMTPTPSSMTRGPPPLYILYTSGSTGKPKGVRGTVRGLVQRLQWQGQRFPWTRLDPFAIGEVSPSWGRDESSADDAEEGGAGGGCDSYEGSDSAETYKTAQGVCFLCVCCDALVVESSCCV